MKSRKKPLRPRTLRKRASSLPKPYTFGGRKIDNRELQDIVESLGCRLVPKTELTPVEELQNRLDRMLVRAEAAFDAGKDASEDIKKFSEVFVPLINDVRKELAVVRTEQLEARQAHAELARKQAAEHEELARNQAEDRRLLTEHHDAIAKHHERLTALEERAKGL